jgi:hypothetical protein
MIIRATNRGSIEGAVQELQQLLVRKRRCSETIPEPRTQDIPYLSPEWSSPGDKFKDVVTPRIIYNFSGQSSRTPRVLSRKIVRSQTLAFHLSWCWFASIREVVLKIWGVQKPHLEQWRFWVSQISAKTVTELREIDIKDERNPVFET